MRLELGFDVLRSYKRLPYTAWHALAEFVDNSTQSYFNNRDVLDAAYADEGAGLEVSIVYDKDGAGTIRISDNAMGMSRSDLQTALHIGQPPADASGRSRYGLGMKMAACWFGNNWSITTKKLGETVEYSVTLDVESIASGNADLVETTVTDLPATDHYTRIEITHLNRKPQGRTLGKMKDFLGGMYRLDIQQNVMRLVWQGVPLTDEVSWVFLKDTLGTEYRKNFEFRVNGKRAWGWVGVLEVGGRPKGGFAIVHQNRMVQTWPDAWHPESIYGQLGGSNDLINQRLVGEINLDAFEVSHTKDSIHWQEDEEDVVQAQLAAVCAEYRDVALRTRKKTRLKEAAVQAAAQAMEVELRSPELLDLIEQDAPAEELVAADEQALVAETDTSSLDFRATLQVFSRKVEILGVLDTTKSFNDPYVVSEATQPDRVVIVINMQHPHLSTIDENGLLAYFKQCTYDALAEWRARNQATQTIDPGTIRRIKDQMLRVGFEIEMHQSGDED